MSNGEKSLILACCITYLSTLPYMLLDGTAPDKKIFDCYVKQVTHLDPCGTVLRVLYEAWCLGDL